ncbi:MAG: hypothetical protein GY909_10495 [Oligoflexia bacterium]|nr:hypothetical protein [Oligoflexia bacterium]
MNTELQQQNFLKSGNTLFQTENKKDRQIKLFKYFLLVLLTNMLTYQVCLVFNAPSPQQKKEVVSKLPSNYKRVSIIGKAYIPVEEIKGQPLSISSHSQILTKNAFVRDISRYDQIGDSQLYKMTIDIQEKDISKIINHAESLEIIPLTKNENTNKRNAHEIIF